VVVTWVARGQSRGVYHLKKELKARCEYFGLIRTLRTPASILQLDDRRSTSMNVAGDVQLRAIGVAGYGVGPGGYGHASAYGLIPVIIVAPEGVLFSDAAEKVHQMWAQFFEERC
jgi:hypothetical protein